MDVEVQAEDKCVQAVGQSESDNDNFMNNTGRPCEMGDWAFESSDDDEEEGFEGWPVWSPASFNSKVSGQNEGFKGLLR